MSFITKDSGKRVDFPSGMRRDDVTDKPRYTLIWTPILTRFAQLLSRGASKYGDRNWELASSQEEMDRFKDSALRHMYQWLDGDESEDHAVAVWFNIMGVEYVKDKIKNGKRSKELR